MKRTYVSVLAAAVVLASKATAAVTLTFTSAAVTSAWLPTFGDGNLAASLVATASGNAVGEAINTGSVTMFGQSFKGNGQYLQAWGFYGNGANASAVDYTIRVIDHGTTGPVTTFAAFNPAVPNVLVSDTFQLTNTPGGQLYFDFSGASTVLLQADHYYSTSIVATSGSAFFTRLTGGNSTYADGTGAKGLGSLNPDAFAGVGLLRDTIFSVYTSVIPEPSTYALFAGAGACALALARRRRS